MMPFDYLSGNMASNIELEPSNGITSELERTISNQEFIRKLWQLYTKDVNSSLNSTVSDVPASSSKARRPGKESLANVSDHYLLGNKTKVHNKGQRSKNDEITMLAMLAIFRSTTSTIRDQTEWDPKYEHK